MQGVQNTKLVVLESSNASKRITGHVDIIHRVSSFGTRGYNPQSIARNLELQYKRGFGGDTPKQVGRETNFPRLYDLEQLWNMSLDDEM